MATLEFQKYVIARTVWTENILVSGRLVNISGISYRVKNIRRGPTTRKRTKKVSKSGIVTKYQNLEKFRELFVILQSFWKIFSDGAGKTETQSEELWK